MLVACVNVSEMGLNQIRESAAQNEQKKTDAESTLKQTRKQGNIYNTSLMSLFLAYRCLLCAACRWFVHTYSFKFVQWTFFTFLMQLRLKPAIYNCCTQSADMQFTVPVQIESSIIELCSL